MKDSHFGTYHARHTFSFSFITHSLSGSFFARYDCEPCFLFRYVQDHVE